MFVYPCRYAEERYNSVSEIKVWCGIVGGVRGIETVFTTCSVVTPLLSLIIYFQESVFV